jgi:hypothetical protein
MSMCSACTFYAVIEYSSMPDWGKEKEDMKIAKLPKRVKLKNGQWIYLR